MVKIRIIGGGPAGYQAAIEAADAGFQVSLYEKNRIGGVCLNEGCIPSKTLLKESMAYFRKEKISPKQWQNLKKGIYSKISLLRSSMERTLNRKGVVLHSGDMLEPGEDYTIYAIGRIWEPLEAVSGKKIYHSAAVEFLDEIPDRIAILGGGISGMEYAQIFAFLGAKVTVYEKEERILNSFSEELAMRFTEACYDMGIEIQTGFTGTLSEISEECIVAMTHPDAVLGKETCEILGQYGIETLETGIVTDEGWKTSREKTYAIGDCTGITGTAYEGKMAAETVVKKIRRMTGSAWEDQYDQKQRQAVKMKVLGGKYDLLEIGDCTGMYAEAGAHESGYCFMTDVMDTYVRIYGNEEGTIRGVRLMMPSGAELAGMFSAAIESEMKIQTLADGMFFHPGVGECIKKAAQNLYEVFNCSKS